jgi:FkbM family methyltransferase
MRQFLHTLKQIVHSDSVGTFRGVFRHFHWQVRKVSCRFPCELPIAGSRLYVDQPGGVAALVNSMGEYDYNNMSLLRLLLSRGKNTFFDIGANIGSYTLIASEVADATVVSIEPHPETFALLEQNVRRNGRDNVVCLKVALSGEEGEVRFTSDSESSTNRVVQAEENGEGKLRVPCRRLDAVCRELKLVPDLIKIDVEGYEVAVLKGFGEFTNAAKLIFIEGGERAKVRSWMDAAGYSGPWFPHFKRKLLSKEKQGRPEDPVFVHKEFLRALHGMNIEVA